MSEYKNPPKFNSTSKPYKRYIEELQAWCIVTELDKNKRGLAVALSLPENDPSGIRDKIFNEIKIEDLNRDAGIDALIIYMDKLFKKDEISEVYERYTVFDRYEKVKDMKMDEYLLEFEKHYNRIKQKEMELSQSVLAFKLLDACKISHHERQLVLTAVHYEEKETLFDQMKASLRKFYGEQSMSRDTEKESGVKLEVKYEEALYQSNYPKFGTRYTGRNSYRGRDRNENKRSTVAGEGNSEGKKTNPIGRNGRPWKCRICESVMHLDKTCPHQKEDTTTLFIKNKKEEMCLLTSEASNAAFLDSGCS